MAPGDRSDQWRAALQTGTARAALQTGTAAGLSWWIASDALGHGTPLSAPVVSAISIGAAMGQRARRTLEAVLGVSIGIGLATLLVATFGRGPLLLALVVTAGMLVAAAARGGELLVMQTGITAILVFAAAADSAPAAGSRFVDALIGGGCAAAVSLFVLPPDPARLLVTRVHALLEELEAVLADVASALRRRDGARAAAALERARATDELVAALRSARPVALEIARFVPARRAGRKRVARIAAAAPHLDHAVRNGRVLARAALAAVLDEERAALECAGVAEDLARAVSRLDSAWSNGQDDRPATELAARAADRVAVLHEQSRSLPLGAVAAATRGIADDLSLAATATTAKERT